MPDDQRSPEQTLRELVPRLPERHRYRFYPTVAALMRLWNLRSETEEADSRSVVTHPLGISFRSSENLAFPSTDVLEAGVSDQPDAVDVVVGFTGLSGSLGTMPPAFTALLADSADSNRKALRDFLAIFDNRSIGLFFRLCESQQAIADSPALASADGQIAFGRPTRSADTDLLDAITGYGLDVVSGKTVPAGHPFRSIPEYLRYYSGIASTVRRSASQIQAMLQEILGMQVRVKEYVGTWISIPQNQRSRLEVGKGETTNNRLGQSFVAGSRTWNVDQRVDLQIGPVNQNEFDRLLPGEDLFEFVTQLMQRYFGIEYDIRIRPILKSGQYRGATLGSNTQLGRTCWLGRPHGELKPPPFQTFS